MSFIHLIHIGHFERDGDSVRFSNTANDPMLKPVVSRPIEMDLVQQSTQEIDAYRSTDLLFPADWEIWSENGYLTADRYALTPEAVRFITRLKQMAGCDLVDFNSRSTIEVTELRPARGVLADQREEAPIAWSQSLPS